VEARAADSGRFTALYYPHAVWDPNWGGETLFFNDDALSTDLQTRSRAEVMACVYPRPKRLVVFSGSIPHVARPTGRRFADLRITLMFKTEAAAT
jgi:SM-20-related protein